HPRCSRTKSQQPNSPVRGIKAELAEWFLSNEKAVRAFGGSVVSGLTFFRNPGGRSSGAPRANPGDRTRADRARPEPCSARPWLPAFVPFRVTAAPPGLTFVNKVFHQA